MPKIRGVKPDYWTDEDIVDLSIPARLLYIGLWNYACDNGHLQDKPKQIKMRIFPGDDVNATELLRELEASGRITRADGWITVPNLIEHQKVDRRYFTTCDHPGCVDPPEKVSQRAARRAHDVHTPGTQGAHDGRTTGARGDGDGEVMVNEGEGDSPRSLTLAEARREDVDRICEHLARLVEANGSKRPTIGKTWRDAARLMLDRDGRTEQEIHGAIEWCQAHEFWRSNILSLPKLREQFDQLRLQAQRQQRGPMTTRQAAEEAMWDRAYARADARGDS